MADPAGDDPAAALAELVHSLTRAEASPGASATENAVAVLAAAQAIAGGSATHPFAAFIGDQVRYFEPHIRHATGADLVRVFEPFAAAHPGQALDTIRTVLAEFLRNIATRLAEHDLLPLPRAAGGADCRIVVVNGLHRTGSTRVFLALQALAQAAWQPYVVRHASMRDVDILIDCALWGAFRGRWLLIKSHVWMPVREQDRQAAKVFYSKRSVADTTASTVQLSTKHNSPPEENANGLINQIIYQQFIDRYCAAAHPLINVQYEEFYRRDAALISFVAEKLGIALDPEALAAAAAAIDVDRIKAIADAMLVAGSDDTMIQRFHVSDTLGKPFAALHLLPEAAVTYLKLLGEWPV